MKDAEYWNSFYSRKSLPLIPSQFAAFVLNEIHGNDEIIYDLGCGNGRDSFFFAQFGNQVCGLDSSSSTIEINNKAASGVPNLTFQQIDLAKSFSISTNSAQKVVVYARFLFHAVDEVTQNNIFATLRDQMPAGSKLFCEFRTDRDRDLMKVALPHYRRFINTTSFIAELSHTGFKINYHREGFGFAKFREEDAHVCRIIAEKC